MFKNVVKMVHILFPENFKFRTLSGIYCDGPQKDRQISFLPLAYLNERNDANKLRKIAITSRDKQAAVKSFRLTLQTILNKHNAFVWPETSRNSLG